MIHVFKTKAKTLCEMPITKKQDYWGHPLAKDGGPVGEGKADITCPSCAEEYGKKFHKPVYLPINGSLADGVSRLLDLTR